MPPLIYRQRSTVEEGGTYPDVQKHARDGCRPLSQTGKVLVGDALEHVAAGTIECGDAGTMREESLGTPASQ